MLNKNGFTLIELIMVILIIGILGVVAIPKYSEMQGEARVAAVKGLKGAIAAAAAVSSSKCETAPTCNNATDYDAASGNRATIGGNEIRFHRGNPIAWGSSTTTSAYGIEEVVDFSGFTMVPYVGGSFARVFSKDGAPTESQCSVTYTLYWNSTDRTVTMDTTGCGAGAGGGEEEGGGEPIILEPDPPIPPPPPI